MGETRDSTKLCGLSTAPRGETWTLQTGSGSSRRETERFVWVIPHSASIPIRVLSRRCESLPVIVVAESECSSTPKAASLTVPCSSAGLAETGDAINGTAAGVVVAEALPATMGVLAVLVLVLLQMRDSIKLCRLSTAP